MNAQQRWQKRNLAAGLCRRCGARPLKSTCLCEHCLQKQRDYYQRVGKARLCT